MRDVLSRIGVVPNDRIIVGDLRSTGRLSTFFDDDGEGVRGVGLNRPREHDRGKQEQTKTRGESLH